ncbi:MAG: OadG family protein [Treponema sp.]|jgi:sodium pump decarboxylase gamma subunit|nr:OadG family protein [Treponema sp.]
MTILQMLQQSAILTVLGMTVVFVFLWIMILCVNGTGKLIRRMGMDKDIQESQKSPPKKAGAVTPEVVSAISAAVTEFRKGE